MGIAKRFALGGLAVGLFATACSTPPTQAAARPADSPVPARSVTQTGPAAAPASRRAIFSLGGEMTQGGWVKGVVPGGTVRLTLDGNAVAFDEDGAFFAAFDRDQKASAILRAQLGNGRMVDHPLTISPRAWKIEHVNVARSPGGPTEAFMRIRRPELARIEAARQANARSQGWSQSFVWPARGRISGRFGSQRVYRGEPGAYHSGIDISTGTSGTPFVAPADGVVVLAAQQPFTLEGNLLMIDHGMGLNSAFLHCSQIMVKEGDRVKQGQLIGRIGATGRATGPHLHWSLKWHDARLDPLLFTGPMP